MLINTDLLLSLYHCSFNPLNAFIWFELFGEPTDRDVDLLGGVKLHCIFIFIFFEMDCIFIYIILIVRNQLPGLDINCSSQVIQAWYVMGRLGAFNSNNLQVGLGLFCKNCNDCIVHYFSCPIGFLHP
jgi:hypothetical protein